MLNFLLVSHYLPPSRYGQPRVIQRLLQNLPAESYALASVESYDRSRVQPDQDGPWLPGDYIHLQKLDWLDRILIRRPLVPYARLLGALPEIWFRSRQLSRLIRERRSDVTIACSGDIADLPAAWLASKRTGCAFIPYMFDDYVEQWAFQPQLRRLAAALERRFIGDAAKVIVPNEFLRREYQARYGLGDKLVVINNPWLSDVSPPSGEAVRRDGPKRIVYTGSIYHVHFDAFATLCQALGLLDGKATLDIYSATPAETLTVNGLDRFVHHGHVDDKTSAAVQRDADILFLPLAFQSSAQAVIRTSAPGKMGEYLSSGRPLLIHAPADSYIAWYGREHDCAEVVTERDPTALAAAIQRLLTQPGHAAKLVANAKARAQADFSPEVAATRFAQTLACVSSQSGSGA